MRTRSLLYLPAILCLAGAALAAVPQLMNYQGILLDGSGNPIVTPVGVVFTIYDAANGGNNLWDEPRNVTPDAQGRFNINLGEGDPMTDAVFAAPDRWLGIKVGADPEMIPRTRLVTVPYAYRAATVDGSGTSWDLIGNAGTTPGTHFLGTTDNQALEVKVNNARSFRLEPHAESPNVIGGYSGNTITAGAYGSVIAGGGFLTGPNVVTDAYGFVGGGRHNQAGDGAGSTSDRAWATVGGGVWNYAMGAKSTIAGGGTNYAMGEAATVGGGGRNKARGAFSVIAGGGGNVDADTNSALGDYSAIGGGRSNVTSGIYASIGGGSSNRADDRSFIGGGTDNAAWNLSVVGGGMMNLAQGGATVGGGTYDTVFGGGSTIGGGLRNLATADGDTATIGGGAGNTVDATYATVSGGGYNVASGPAATIPGGLYNQASGFVSFAAGSNASAGHDRTFVWNGGVGSFGSTNAGQFLINASGGVGIGTNSPAYTLDVAGTAQMQGFRMPGGTNGYVLTSDASGNGSWQAAGGGGWSLTGNAGTTPGTNFIGTSDNQALELKVNNTRALRLEPTAAEPNVIGGNSGNWVSSGATGATIAGGGSMGGYNNRVTDRYGVVGGGEGNQAGDNAGTVYDRSGATVGGGRFNTASGQQSSVVGGSDNTASGLQAFVGGGYIVTASGSGAVACGGNTNQATGSNAFVGGGGTNLASGWLAMIPGGTQNTAAGEKSFAAGSRAKANHNGAFVWADDNNYDFASTATKQFNARCTGGVRFVTGIDGSGVPNAGVQVAAGGTSWSAICDRNLKENFAPVDAAELLQKVAALPLMTWNAKAQDPSIRHIGPVAQDFYAAFGVGEDSTHITTVDADGVALAAIQALHQKTMELEEKTGEIEILKQQLKEVKGLLQQVLAERR